MAYDFYLQDSWKPTTRPDARARFEVFALAAVGRDERRDGVIPAAVLRPGDRTGYRSQRQAGSSSAAIGSTASFCRVTSRLTRRCRIPTARQPAAAVSRGAERILRDAQGRLAASSRDGLRHQRDDDVQGRCWTVPESRADQHDGGLRFQRAALRNADRHQRRSWIRRAAPRHAISRSSARCSRPSSPTRRHGRGTPQSIAQLPWQMRGDDVVCRALGVAPRARA